MSSEKPAGRPGGARDGTSPARQLAEDPDPDVRRTAALRLASQTAVGAVREALHAAAAEDEDLNVRWAARYALRLAAADGPGDSGRTSAAWACASPQSARPTPGALRR
jgi:HEAT repeats